jgi:prolyl-tRNA synthetase
MRPRFGLMRGREFIMKDAYSFHSDDASAYAEYENMYGAYRRIFERCGLKFRAVEADTGAIGGSRSHEFQVLAESGEDALVSCNRCDYAANVEKAELRPRGAAADGAGEGFGPAMEKVKTPGQKTIEEVSAFLKIAPQTMVKTMVYLADGKPVVALVRGDRDVNELKLKSLLGAQEVVLPTEQAITETTGAPVGFLGPAGMKEGVAIYADLEVAQLASFTTGANQVDYHVKNVRMGRDFQAQVADLRRAAPGDACARCDGGVYEGYRGIEVGHVFFLGTKYSAAMKAHFLDAEGTEKAMVMGCYGIGITRTMAASIEQAHDADGIIWPMALAPFHVVVLPLQGDDPQVKQVTSTLVTELEARGLEVLVDDRDERPGVKFKDADLIGIPLRLAIGKKGLAQGKVELKPRASKEVQLIDVTAAAATVADLVQRELSAAKG